MNIAVATESNPSEIDNLALDGELDVALALESASSHAGRLD